jgi:hypothetical protein
VANTQHYLVHKESANNHKMYWICSSPKRVCSTESMKKRLKKLLTRFHRATHPTQDETAAKTDGACGAVKRKRQKDEAWTLGAIGKLLFLVRSLLHYFTMHPIYVWVMGTSTTETSCF